MYVGPDSREGAASAGVYAHSVSLCHSGGVCRRCAPSIKGQYLKVSWVNLGPKLGSDAESLRCKASWTWRGRVLSFIISAVPAVDRAA